MSRGCPEASVTLIPGDTDNIFLGLEQGSLEISDIRIDCKNVNIGLMAHSGELRLSNVTLMGGGTSVLVGPGARLVMSGSKVTDAGIGVEIGSGKLSLSCHQTVTAVMLQGAAAVWRTVWWTGAESASRWLTAGR